MKTPLLIINLIPMRICLSKKEALAELQFLYTLGKNPSFALPAFYIETQHLYLFACMVKCMPDSSNIVPIIDEIIDRALEESVDQICQLLDKHKVDGTEIFHLISEKEFILTRVKKAYNKKVPGKSPKGLLSTIWSAYNNWLLSAIFWKAYVQSHNPDYKVFIIDYEDPEAPVEAFFDPDYRALWAMKNAYMEAGKPTHGCENDDIFISPIREWNQFIKTHGIVINKGVMEFKTQRLDSPH